MPPSPDLLRSAIRPLAGERGAADISAILRTLAPRSAPAWTGLMNEAADKLDELLACLVDAENARDEARAQNNPLRAQVDALQAALNQYRRLTVEEWSISHERLQEDGWWNNGVDADDLVRRPSDEASARRWLDERPPTGWFLVKRLTTPWRRTD